MAHTDMTDLGIGDRLRAAREARGVSLSEAEAGTRIRRRYLEALEAERFGEIPGPFYVRGFLRGYATYLGLDADPLIQELVSSHPELRGGPSAARDSPGVRITPVTPYSRARRIVGASLLVIAIGLGALVYIAYEQIREFVMSAPPSAPQSSVSAPAHAGTKQKTSAPPASPPAAGGSATSTPAPPGPMSPTAPVPESAAGATQGTSTGQPPGTAQPPSAPGAPTTSPAPPNKLAPAPGAPLPHAPYASPPTLTLAASPRPEAPAGPVRVQVTATTRAWLRAVVDGVAVYDGVLSPGDHRSWQAGHTVTLSVANGGAFNVTVNGHPLGRLGGPEEVVEKTYAAGLPPTAP